MHTNKSFLLRVEGGEGPDAWVLVGLTADQLLRIQRDRQALLTTMQAAPNIRHIAFGAYGAVLLLSEKGVKVALEAAKEKFGGTSGLVAYRIPEKCKLEDYIEAEAEVEEIRFNEVGLSFSGAEDFMTYSLPYELVEDAPQARSNIVIAADQLIWGDDSENKDGSVLSTVIRICETDFYLKAHAVQEVDDVQRNEGEDSRFTELNDAFLLSDPQDEVTINGRQYVLFGHAGVM